MRRLALVAAVAVACGGGKKDQDERREELGSKEPELACAERYPLPQPELAADKIVLDLPAVPSFAVPARYPDGALTVRELQVAGRRLLGQEVAVRGRITSIYRCADPDPARCAAPQFRIADAAGASPLRSLSVVEVAQPPPELAVGDEVTVTGTWTQASPGGSRDVDGLLVFGSLGAR